MEMPVSSSEAILKTISEPVRSSSRRPSTTDRQETSQGRRTILVMDDDVLVRKILRKMLGSAGYAASFVVNGKDAIEKFRRATALQQPFDAVILDLNITRGMQGSEAMKMLRSMDPSVRALLLTGDIAHPAVARYEACGFRAVLLKPFTHRDLMDAIDCTLND